jgi:stress response protein SCP2
MHPSEAETEAGTEAGTKAEAETEAAGRLAVAGQGMIDRLLRTGIDGLGPFKSADECAQEALSRGRTPEQAVRTLIRTHVAMAGAQGFVLNLGGLVTSLAALPANVAAAYLIQTRLAASIARVHGHDLGTDEVRTAIVLCLLGNNAAEVVKKVGVKVGERLTRKLIERIPGRVLVEINKKVGMRLLTKAGQSGAIVLTKGVPVVGGVIGAGFDAVATRAVGEFARRFLGPDATVSLDRPNPNKGPRQRLTVLRAAVDRRLRRADKVELTKPADSPKVVDVRVGWTAPGIDVDASAFVCDAGGRVRSDRDFVYFNNRSEPDGSVRLVEPTGDDATADGVRATFSVDLASLPAEVHAVRFAVSVYEGRATLGAVDDLFVQVIDGAGVAEPITCDAGGDYPTDTAVVLGELRRTAHSWEFDEIGEGHPGGLASIAKHHGVNV